MGVQDNSFGKLSGLQYEKPEGLAYDQQGKLQTKADLSNKDEDLVIEENTIYEIDRDCYERLKRQKKRKI